MENYGINKEFAHPKAVAWFPEKFFWSCTNEFAPLGSDEGDSALDDFRRWRKKNPTRPLLLFVASAIRQIGGFDPKEFTNKLATYSVVKRQIADRNYDHEYQLEVLGIVLISTGFGQFVDEGKIDDEVIPIIKVALERHITYVNITSANKALGEQHINILSTLLERLKQLKVHQDAGELN